MIISAGVENAKWREDREEMYSSCFESTDEMYLLEVHPKCIHSHDKSRTLVHFQILHGREIFDSPVKMMNTFIWIYLGVKTCEIFLCFVAIVGVRILTN